MTYMRCHVVEKTWGESMRILALLPGTSCIISLAQTLVSRLDEMDSWMHHVHGVMLCRHPGISSSFGW
jgi:hypothetical protein